MAMGMVMPMVKTPQGLLDSALTTTIPSPANVTSKMNRMAIMTTRPEKGPISVRAISARDLPLCRTEATRTVKSCTAPAITAPTTSQISPGANPNCAASVGPDQRPRSGDGRKMLPEENPLRRRQIILSVFRVCAGVSRSSFSTSTLAARKAL